MYILRKISCFFFPILLFFFSLFGHFLFPAFSILLQKYNIVLMYSHEEKDLFPQDITQER